MMTRSGRLVKRPLDFQEVPQAKRQARRGDEEISSIKDVLESNSIETQTRRTSERLKTKHIERFQKTSDIGEPSQSSSSSSSFLETFSLPYAKTDDRDLLQEINERSKKDRMIKVDKTSSSVLKDYEKSLRLKKLPFGLVIKELPQIGHTLFLSKKAEALPQGSFIGIYSGEILARKEEELLSCNTDYLYSLIDNPTEEEDQRCVYVDALPKGNYTRFINHSLSPNVGFFLNRFTHLQDTNSPCLQICLKTIKTIEPGQMVLVDYGEFYWSFKDFVPVVLSPTTYTLEGNDKVIPGEDLAFQTPEVRDLLARCRNALGDMPVGTEIPDEEHFSQIPVNPLTSAEKNIVEQIDNEVFEGGITRNLTIAPLPGQAGEYGVFLKPTAAPIHEGALIGVYAGVVKLQSKGEVSPMHSYFLGEVDGKDIIVDGTEEGNFTRYFQKSRKGSENVLPVIKTYPFEELNVGDNEIKFPDQLQVVFYAHKDIQPGEQLVVSWSTVSHPELHPRAITPRTYLLGMNGQARRFLA